VGSRVGLDAVVRRKNSSPCRESNSDLLARNLITTLSELPLLRMSRREDGKESGRKVDEEEQEKGII
jgi:hypothetical protein